MVDNQFSESFVEFVQGYFDNAEGHLFFCLSPEGTHSLRRRTCVRFKSDFRNSVFTYLHLARQMNAAEKVIIHGMWGGWVTWILFARPKLLKKCYWVIWGWDLYSYRSAGTSLKDRLRELRRRNFIQRVGNLVTYVDGDVDLAREWYGAKGKYHECLMYPSNVYTPTQLPKKDGGTIHIQVGNSADPANNYEEVLEALAAYKDRDIRIYAVLSYGPTKYAAEIAQFGRELFGEKFQPITKFLSHEEYTRFLARIDIAIFNHRRQQAMGNIITLLGLGKKVYLREGTTHQMLFDKLGVAVYPISELDLSPLSEVAAGGNRAIIERYFSTQALVDGYKNIFA